MRNSIALSGVFLAITASGCVTTNYIQTIEVTKDADGKVLKTVETESVVQPNQGGFPVQFKYLKGVNPSDQK